MKQFFAQNIFNLDCGNFSQKRQSEQVLPLYSTTKHLLTIHFSTFFTVAQTVCTEISFSVFCHVVMWE